MTCPTCNDTGIAYDAFRCFCAKVAALETAMNDRPIQVGDLVQTFYPTACGHFPIRRSGGTPYEIVEIHGPCTCPPYLAVINNMGKKLPPGPEHYHFVGRNPYSGATGYLNCHLMTGEDVYEFTPGENYLLIVGERVMRADKVEGFQMGLFA